MKNLYRQGVGAIVINEKRYCLMGERLDAPGCWQFPQGGIDEGETHLKALQRELIEEVNLFEYDLLSSESFSFAYTFPVELRKKQPKERQIYCGQKLHWFAVKASNPDTITPHTSKPEFGKLKWVSFDTIAETVPFFKKEMYRALQCFFKDFF